MQKPSRWVLWIKLFWIFWNSMVVFTWSSLNSWNGTDVEATQVQCVMSYYFVFEVTNENTLKIWTYFRHFKVSTNGQYRIRLLCSPKSNQGAREARSFLYGFGVTDNLESLFTNNDTYNGAETNCRIAHVLGILLMISYWFAFFFSDIIVICTVSMRVPIRTQNVSLQIPGF